MKKRQGFILPVDSEGKKGPHYSGDSLEGKKEIVFKIGDDIPNRYVSDLLMFNPQLLDVVLENEKAVLSDAEKSIYDQKLSAQESIKTYSKVTEQELLALNKSKQVSILSSLNSNSPSTEKERVKLILLLQDEGKDVSKLV